MKTLTSRLTTIFTEHLGIDADQVTPQASLIDDLGADSLDLVELLMAVEEEFQIEITDDAWEQAETVESAQALIEQHLQAT